MHAAVAKRQREEEEKDNILTDIEKEPFTLTIRDLAGREKTVATEPGWRTLGDLRNLIHRTFDVPPHLQRWTIRGSSFPNKELDDRTL